MVTDCALQLEKVQLHDCAEMRHCINQFVRGRGMHEDSRDPRLGGTTEGGVSSFLCEGVPIVYVYGAKSNEVSRWQQN